MKTLKMSEWEDIFQAEDTERFDQKNTMFNRPNWDAKINGLLDDWSFTGKVRNTPGYALEDQALRWACRRGTMISLFNINKPNPSRLTKALLKTMSDMNAGIPASTYQPPQGVKADISDLRSITGKVKKTAKWFGADLVGICKLDRRWIYSHTYGKPPFTGSSGQLATAESIVQEIPDEFQTVVVLAFEQDYDMLRYIPSYIASAAVSMGYSRLAITSNYLTAFIKFLGFKAIDCSVNDVALSIPQALQAGLGELSRFGLLITRPYGPRVRLTSVITDLPLEHDSPVEFGAMEFCKACKKCVSTCPSSAITPDQPTNEPLNASNSAGQLKWRIDAEKCRATWSRFNRPCTICVSVCPFNKVNTWPHKTVHWFIDHLRWANRLYVWGDDLLGYGKPKRGNNFWEEWEPRKN